MFLPHELAPPPPSFYVALRRATGGLKGDFRVSPDHTFQVTDWVGPSEQDGWVRLVREGKTVSMYYYNIRTQEWTLHDTREIELVHPIYVALAAWSPVHHEMVVGHFRDVQLTRPAQTSSAENWDLYR